MKYSFFTQIWKHTAAKCKQPSGFLRIVNFCWLFDKMPILEHLKIAYHAKMLQRIFAKKRCRFLRALNSQKEKKNQMSNIFLGFI